MELRTIPWPRPFTSRLTRREAIFVLAYFPVHLIVLQLVLSLIAAKELLSLPAADLLYYLVGFLYMVLAAFGFLRRDFDALIDAPLACIREVLRDRSDPWDSGCRRRRQTSCSALPRRKPGG